ncbi:M10 family metallopeptidase C-terminal domain-containing protein [Antarctobacter jejuensis]|uniref:M10 family metallopeptidase C-terminal domain-containing protein n=1 Tax=Antarctobacter jejuensis TaxID=1439938 RepID=UPI003FCFE18A
MCFLCQSLDPTITEYDAHGLSSTTTDEAPSSAAGSAKPTYTLDQVATQLSHGYWESKGAEWRAFSVDAGGTLTVNIDGLDATGQAAAMTALAAWTAVSGLQFQTTSGTADISFDDEESGAYAWSSIYVGWNQIASSHVNVHTSWQEYGDYYTQTFIHEIGHALGLGHGGDYNGSADFDTQAHYANDSWQMSVMSYFSQWENDNVDASYNYLATASMADILAIQNLYGTPTNVNTGNTTYGDNTNLTQLGMDLSTDWAVTIFDSTGVDLVDLGTRNFDQRLDLNAEAWSDLNGEIGNFGIARGAVIENAITGSGDDAVTGNAANNDIQTGAGVDTITGGAGDDTIDGGAGNDTLLIEGTPDGYDLGWDGYMLSISDTDLSTGADQGTDHLTGIETLSFSGGYTGIFESDAATTTLRVSANGSALTSRLLQMDTSDSYDWSSIARTFVAGKWETQTNTYDDGRVLEIEFTDGLRTAATMMDAADIYGWECYTDSYDLEGAKTANETTWDTGKVVETYYANGQRSGSLVTDGADDYSWHTIHRGYDQSGTLTLQTNTYDDGRVQEIAYTNGVRSSISMSDTGNTASWSSYTDSYASSGARTQRVTIYDDGREVTNLYSGSKVVDSTIVDGADAFVWTSINRTWDNTGNLDSLTTTYDDGRLYETDYVDGFRSSAVLSDVADAYAWDHATETFDDLGNLIERITVWDDGSQSVMTY